LWIAAGLADYILHKRTRIEDNAGTKESVLHAIQLSEAGVPILLGLLFEVNALIILVMLIALVLHEVTALWDVAYASTRRYVSPLEQHVHSFMEVLPFMAVAFLTVMYWNQFAALLGLGAEPARFELRPKSLCSCPSAVLSSFPMPKNCGAASARRLRGVSARLQSEHCGPPRRPESGMPDEPHRACHVHDCGDWPQYRLERLRASARNPARRELVRFKSRERPQQP
jgi:hypothetical protein